MEYFSKEEELEHRIQILEEWKHKHEEDILESPQAKAALAFIMECKCGDKYSIESHGNGYALYFGRCPHRHGYNLMHITEVTREGLLSHIEKLLNKTH